jgi:hypothetical protein
MMESLADATGGDGECGLIGLSYSHPNPKRQRGIQSAAPGLQRCLRSADRRVSPVGGRVHTRRCELV